MIQRTLLLACVLLAAAAARAAADPIAVIVHPRSPVTNLSLKELKAAFEGYGLPGLATKNVTLVYLRGETEDRFNLQVLGISSKQAKVYWLRRVFEGESDTRKMCATAAEVRESLAQNQAAIGFLPAAELDASIRAITLDGKGHGSPDYPLK